MGIVEPTKRGNLSQHRRKIIVALIRLDKGFFIGGKEEVAKLYTKEDLLVKNKIFANLLTTKVLEDFYTDNLTQNAYIYTLDNGEIIHLTFDTDQFCHLLGFSYFGYNGIAGWNQLKNRNILITNLNDFAKHKREEIRITNFPKIITILNNPTVYLYKNDDMRYKSDYFAVWNDGKRYYKLGIGTSANGVNYGETFQVSLMTSNDNQEINPDKWLVVTNKFLMPRETFQNLYYPIHIKAKKNEEKAESLFKQLQEVQRMQWEIMLNAATD